MGGFWGRPDSIGLIGEWRFFGEEVLGGYLRMKDAELQDS